MFSIFLLFPLPSPFLQPCSPQTDTGGSWKWILGPRSDFQHPVASSYQPCGPASFSVISEELETGDGGRPRKSHVSLWQVWAEDLIPILWELGSLFHWATTCSSGWRWFILVGITLGRVRNGTGKEVSASVLNVELWEARSAWHFPSHCRWQQPCWWWQVADLVGQVLRFLHLLPQKPSFEDDINSKMYDNLHCE